MFVKSAFYKYSLYHLCGMNKGFTKTKYFKAYVIVTTIVLIAIMFMFYYLSSWTAANPDVVMRSAEIVTNYGILGIFVFAILAGTVIPFPTEPIFGAMAVLGSESVISLTLAAAIGNVIGTLISFCLARYLREAYVYKHVKKENIKSFHGFWQKNGDWLLFFTLLIPIMPGDIVAFVAGLSNMKMGRFFVISLTAKLIEFTFFALVAFKVAELWFPMFV